MVSLSAIEPSGPLVFAETPAAIGARAIGKGMAYWFGQPSPERNGRSSEDSLALIPRGGSAWVLAVADGLGGAPNGEGASRAALEELKASLTIPGSQPLKSPAALREAVLRGFDRANRAVRGLGTGAATTLAVVTLEGNTARAYHVGDSLILLLGQRGKLKFQSMSHGPVGYGVEAGLIDEREAMHHEERHIVSNFVGSGDMSVQMGPKLELARYDTLVLASDGLSDNLYSEEIVERIRKGNAEQALADLMGLCHKRMTVPQHGRPHKPDDLTVLIYRRCH